MKKIITVFGMMGALALVSGCHTSDSNQGGAGYDENYQNSPVVQTNSRGGSGMNLAPNGNENNASSPATPPPPPPGQ